MRSVKSTRILPIFKVPRRYYGVRGEFDSPFDYMPQRKKPFLSWKMTSLFIVFGSYLAYSEYLFDKYAEFTQIDESNELLPLQLQYKMKQMPIFEKLAHPRVDNEWKKYETWEDMDHNILENKNKSEAQKSKEVSHLSENMSKPGGILIKPVVFHNPRTNEGVSIIHVGYKLCGYPFIVHGGIMATMLNETFKRNASLSNITQSNLKGDYKLENLTISYKYPTFANQFLIIKTHQIPMEGENNRYIKLKSTVESELGKKLVESTATLRDTGLMTSKMKAGSLLACIGF